MGRKVEFTIYRGGIGWVVGPDLGGGEEFSFGLGKRGCSLGTVGYTGVWGWRFGSQQ